MMNVLVEISGKQFKVSKGDKIRVPYINKKIGEKLTFEKILLSDDGKSVKVGNPHVKGLKLEAKLLEHGKDAKVLVFKFKRRKGYQKKNGHKQNFSLIEISGITKGTSKKVASKKTTTKVAPKKATTKADPKKKTTKTATKKKETK
tara:strand:- start:116 stop:553 length:438 start_codon:yes stop_codon:yes gene_type:complete